MAKVPDKSHFAFATQPRMYLAAFRLLATEDHFVRHFNKILAPEHWSEFEGKWVVQEVIKHFEEHKQAPGMSVLRMELDRDRKLKPEQEEAVGKFLDKLDTIEVDERTKKFVLAEFPAHIRHRATLYALRVAHEHVQEGNEDAAVQAIYDSEQYKIRPGDWHFLPDDADEYFKYFGKENIQKVTVPMGIPSLDEAIGGGLRKGELGVIVASLGVGKSMALVHMGAEAFRRGLKVAHWTFENSWEETMGRYLHNLMDTSSEVLPLLEDSPQAWEDLKRDRVKATGGDFVVRELPALSTTPADIEADLQELIGDGFIPDLILVDYADLLSASRRNARQRDRWLELDTIYTELRAIAATRDIAMWTASQANREGAKARGGVRQYHVAGAMGKLNVADVGISISRESRDEDKDVGGEPEEIDSNYRIWRAFKVRRSRDGWRIRLRADYTKARFYETDDVAEMDAAMDDSGYEQVDSWRKTDATD